MSDKLLQQEIIFEEYKSGSKVAQEKQLRMIYSEENKVKKLQSEAKDYEARIKDQIFEINAYKETDEKMKGQLKEYYDMGLR